MSTQAKPFITPEQYLEIEAKAERKSEYYNGEMFLMAGNTSDHSLICVNVSRLFSDQLREKPCYIYESNIRVRILETGLYTYPDAVVVCGNREWSDLARTTLLNPTILVEVLSDSTEAYDRGEKFWHYRHIPSLREYMLISQKAFRIDQYIRQPDGEFKLRSYDSVDATLEVPAVGCSIPLKEIYFKTELMS
jgi:Uma2 family endonuclease